MGGARPASFKAYDIRGQVPNQLNADVVYRIGRAFTAYLQPKRVVVGEDVRLSSGELRQALVRGLTDGGADVAELGLCGTETVYFATDHYHFDGGIMVTASHNPADYNGLKLVREESRPISAAARSSAVEEIRRDEIERLGGEVTLHDREGGGTRWEIRLPVTM